MHRNISLLILIKEHLKARGITLIELAVKMKTNHASLSRMLNGKSRMTIDDLSMLSQILGIPSSSLLREAESKSGIKRISLDVEKLVCSDPRRYCIFLTLNFPKTVDTIAMELGISKTFIEETLKEFQKHGFLIENKKGHYILSDQMYEIAFGRTAEFYKLKSKLFATQSEDTANKLNAGKDFWRDKDDQLTVVRITKAQAETLKMQIQALLQQATNMDDLNFENRTPSEFEKNTTLQALFLTLKPIDNEFMRRLIESNCLQ